MWQFKKTLKLVIYVFQGLDKPTWRSKDRQTNIQLWRYHNTREGNTILSIVTVCEFYTMAMDCWIEQEPVTSTFKEKTHIK
jgi:hypothetical protein